MSTKIGYQLSQKFGESEIQQLFTKSRPDLKLERGAVSQVRLFPVAYS